jgi:hypothetical protein
MKRFRLHRILGHGALCAVLAWTAACVFRTEHKVETVHKIEAHIVLDIRQVEAEASQVEDYVRGESEKPPEFLDENGQPAAKPTSLVRPMTRSARFAALEAGLADLAPAPLASDDVKNAIQARRARAGEVAAALTAQYAGEDDHGYLALRPAGDALGGEAKTKIQNLAHAENGDRRTIYLDAARRAGGDESSLPQVEVVFARSIREALTAGQMFQAPREDGEFGKFKESALGKQYPDAAPGQWLEKK